jgi:hypothetical protein
VKWAGDCKPAHDYRIKSLWTFLFCQGQSELATANMLGELYPYNFERGLSHDVDSEVYIKVCEKLGKDFVEAAKSLVANSALLDIQRLEHRNFQHVVQLCITAMNELLNKQCQQCAFSLIKAIQRDRELTSPLVRREEEIVYLLRLCINSMLGEIMNNMALNNVNNAITLARDAVGYSLMLGTGDPIIPMVKQCLSKLKSEYPITTNIAQVLSGFIEATAHTIRPPLTKKLDLGIAPNLSREDGNALMEKYAETNQKMQGLLLVCEAMLPIFANLNRAPVA